MLRRHTSGRGRSWGLATPRRRHRFRRRQRAANPKRFGRRGSLLKSGERELGGVGAACRPEKHWRWQKRSLLWRTWLSHRARCRRCQRPWDGAGDAQQRQPRLRSNRDCCRHAGAQRRQLACTLLLRLQLLLRRLDLLLLLLRCVCCGLAVHSIGQRAQRQRRDLILRAKSRK